MQFPDRKFCFFGVERAINFITGFLWEPVTAPVIGRKESSLVASQMSEGERKIAIPRKLKRVGEIIIHLVG